jgi:type III secretory pathway component EscU
MIEIPVDKSQQGTQRYRWMLPTAEAINQICCAAMQVLLFVIAIVVAVVVVVVVVFDVFVV